MTTRERNEEINKALHQMSSRVKDFIKEAIANEYESCSNPRNSPDQCDRNNTNNSNKDVPKRNNSATALRVRPPSGKRPESGIRRNSQSSAAVAIKIPQTGAASRPTSGQSHTDSQPSSARPTGRLVHGNNMLSRPESGKSTSSNASSSKHNRSETLKQIGRHYGPLPWKPRVDLTSPVMIQCQMRVVEICGKYLSLALVAKDKQMKKSSLIFLHELLSNSSVGTITVNNEFFKDHTRAWK